MHNGILFCIMAQLYITKYFMQLATSIWRFVLYIKGKAYGLRVWMAWSNYAWMLRELGKAKHETSFYWVLRIDPFDNYVTHVVWAWEPQFHVLRWAMIGPQVMRMRLTGPNKVRDVIIEKIYRILYVVLWALLYRVYQKRQPPKKSIMYSFQIPRCFESNT